MIKKKFISVIIPTYFNPLTLPKAIESIKNQNLQPKEIIVIDNSREKKSENLVFKLKKKYKLNLVYLNNNGNPDQTRNFAAKKANYSWLAFLDDDDVWEKNYLSSNFSLIYNHNLDFTYTNLNIINQNDKKVSFVNLPKNISIGQLFVFNHGFFCSNLILKKNCFFNVGGFDSKSGSADKDLAIKLCEAKYRYRISVKKLVNKRTSNNQWSKNYKYMLKSNIKFFMKYNKKVNFNIQLLMIRKIIKLFINSLFK